MLSKTISDRLCAGAPVVLVEDADEALAVLAAKQAGEQFAPVRVLSGADPDAMQALEQHKEGQGTLITMDLLRVFGGNALAVRTIREIALQNREKYSRLIMVESPGVEIPQVLRGDVEMVVPALPSVEELGHELDGFLKAQGAVLKGNGEARFAVSSAVAGLARHEATRLFGRCLIESGKLDAEWLRREKAATVTKRLGGALTFIEADAAGVGGLDQLKAWLAARRKAFGSAKAREFGLPESKGVLLLGSPGTGKSLTAKTISREWGLPLLRLDVGKLYGSLMGQSEGQTRRAIEAAEAAAPCVLWIDEIEKGFAGSKGGGGDSGTSQRVFGTMLTWLQEKTKPVFVVATANRIADLPPEFLRKGRFDEIFFVDLPSAAERLDIVGVHARRLKREKILDAAGIVAATDGFSGAEIEQAIIDGMFRAFADGREVATADVVAAAQGTVPLSRTMEEEIKAMRKWAAGRAKPAASPAQAEKTVVRAGMVRQGAN